MKVNFLTGTLFGSFIGATIATTIIFIGVLADEADAPKVEQNIPPAADRFPPSSQSDSGSKQVKPPLEPANSAVSPEPNERNTRIHTRCGSSCVEDLTLRFLSSDTALGAEDQDAISDNLDAIAKAISKDPAHRIALREKLIYATTPEEIEQLISLASALPDSLALALLQDAALQSPAHKRAAVSALGQLALASPDAIAELETMLTAETDPTVLSTALDAFQGSDASDLSPQTWRSLGSQFETQNDPALRGAILKALTYNDRADTDTLAAYIQGGIDSGDTDLQIAALESLGDLLADTGSNRTLDADRRKMFRRTIEQLSLDPEADPALRTEALLLLQD